MLNKKEFSYAAKDVEHTYAEHERAILLYLAHLPPPVSLDTLVSISDCSPVTVLNFIEALKKKKVVCEKKEYGKGFYFLDNGGGVPASISTDLSTRERQDIFRKVIDFYGHLPDQGERAILVMADLYMKLGNGGAGISYIKKAADIFYGSGQRLKAIVYYDYVIQQFAATMPARSEAEDFLDSVCKRAFMNIFYRMHLNPTFSLLERGHEVAKHYHRRYHQAQIELIFGIQYQLTGDPKNARRNLNHFWKLAANIEDECLKRTGVLMMTIFMILKGEFLKAIDYYERMTGGLEKFGNTEQDLRATLMIGATYVICGRIARGLGMIEAAVSKTKSINLDEPIITGDLVMPVVLLELRQVSEARKYLERYRKAFLGNVLDPMLPGTYHKCKAYIACETENYKGALEHLKKAQRQIISEGVSGLHSYWQWFLECLYVLESKGFFTEEMNLDSEISHVLAWDNLYMKGVALRYRALRKMDAHKSEESVLSDLKLSEKYLKRVGAEIELARTRIARGNYYLSTGKTAQGKSYLHKAWIILSGIDEDLIPKDLLETMPWEQKINTIIERITEISKSFQTVKDVPSLLDRIINAGMDFTMATRGAFFTLKDGELQVIASRNVVSSAISPDKAALLRDMIIDAIKKDKELIMPKGDAGDDCFRKLDIPSFIGMPVKLHDRPYGYIVLGHHLKETLFSEYKIPFVKMLAAQTALGLSSLGSYEEVCKLKERFEDEAVFYKRKMGLSKAFNIIVGRSEGIRNVIDQVWQVASTDSTVLITGETGVGKELVAKGIHNLSTRKDGPFIPVNISSLPQDLVGSELFGHEKGAFTGAHERQKGRFELAGGGTIFLDEIGDLPLNMQVKLLRVLQEGTFERLGSPKPIRSNFRVIAVTHRDLLMEIEKGVFRRDLYYRLKVFPIHVPPLRERREDIVPLVQHFLEIFAKKMNKKVGKPSPEDLGRLESYQWPGNVRELSHVVERSVVLSRGGKISFSGIDDNVLSDDQGPPGHPATLRMADMEREHILRVLNLTRWRVSGPKGAATFLGMNRSTLRFRMQKLGITRPSRPDK